MATIEVDAAELREALGRIARSAPSSRVSAGRASVQITVDPRGLVLVHGARELRVLGPSRGNASVVLEARELGALRRGARGRGAIVVEVEEEHVCVGDARVASRAVTQLAFSLIPRK